MLLEMFLHSCCLMGEIFSKHWGKINTKDVLTCTRICGSTALQVLLKISPRAEWLPDKMDFINFSLDLLSIEDSLLKFEGEIQGEIFPLEIFCSSAMLHEQIFQ